MNPVDIMSQQYNRHVVGNICRNQRHVGVCFVDVKIFGEDTVFVIGELPAAKRSARLRRVPACDAGSPQSGVIAPTTTRSPGLNSLTSEPTS